MSENLDLVRSICADRENALADLGIDALPRLADPDIEWRDQMHAPDVPEVLQGGYRDLHTARNALALEE
jgi:hypothetical protein